ncbi:hypothetical protein DVH05_005298 [Phytophthora capsici]|nr:hypothetical protein DVH05_005298 [Phytophthora capsici]
MAEDPEFNDSEVVEILDEYKRTLDTDRKRTSMCRSHVARCCHEVQARLEIWRGGGFDGPDQRILHSGNRARELEFFLYQTSYIFQSWEVYWPPLTTKDCYDLQKKRKNAWIACPGRPRSLLNPPQDLCQKKAVKHRIGIIGLR